MRIIGILTLLVCGCAEGKDSERTEDFTGAHDFCAVRTLLDANCVVCHSASLAQGGLDLETDAWTATVGKSSSVFSGAVLVAPGDPSGSLLYRKLVGTQTATEGGPMPPAGVLGDTEQQTVRAWIEAGALAACDGADDSGADDGPNYHPDTFTPPEVHGLAAKFQEEDCTECHGTDLDGGTSGVSCDTCHEGGWRTDCTYCHGGTDDLSGAPPTDIDGLSTDLSFAEHDAHVLEIDHPAEDCVECHDRPSNVLSSGHIFIDDATPGIAEVAFGGGLSDAGAYTSPGSCSNLYCHGNGQSGATGSVDAGETATCTMCHADVEDPGRLSGEHARHVGQGYDCETCHADVVSGDDTITGPDHHVNGRVDVRLPTDISRSSGTCTGSCHGESHGGRNW